MKFIIFLFPFLFTLIFCTGCRTGAKQQQPNILWLVTEDISPALGCYGDRYAFTPNLDKLSENSMVFKNVYATAPICAPSRSCLVTGVYATSLGTQHLRCEITKPNDIKTIPELLREAGYFTSNRNKTDYNFDPDGIWDYWADDLTPWRKRKDDQPFFSFINIGNTHEGPANNQEAYLRATTGLPEELIHDPELASLPPFLPDTPEMKRIWAQYYDLVTAMDMQVGSVLMELEKDGLMNNTIIFFFSDHGFGLPGFKRWLTSNGLHVPLMVHIPERFKYLAPDQKTVNAITVSFVDFAPTVLHIAGVNIPSYMQGIPFIGKSLDATRDYAFAARSRADDMYEVSRAVIGNGYMYIRHYLPHLPYLQPGYIYSDVKSSYRELHRMKNSGPLNDPIEKMFNPKPVEELYLVSEDPHSLINLAGNPEFSDIKKEMHEVLLDWIIDSRDVGFLFEPEYMIRSEGSTPYEMARNDSLYNIREILNAAELTGSDRIGEMIPLLEHKDPGVRFWAVMALMQTGSRTPEIVTHLEKCLKDPSPVVQIGASEALCRLGNCSGAVPVLGKWVTDERPWLALYAARTLQLIGKDGCDLKEEMYEVLNNNMGDTTQTMRYKDFNFAAFTSWALEVALKNCGENIRVNGGR